MLGVCSRRRRRPGGARRGGGQNGAHFVNTEGFRPCLSKPSYRAPKWAIMVRLMQKERLNHKPFRAPLVLRRL